LAVAASAPFPPGWPLPSKPPGSAAAPSEPYDGSDAGPPPRPPAPGPPLGPGAPAGPLGLRRDPKLLLLTPVPFSGSQWGRGPAAGIE
jgi:hypothetical protein